MNQSKSDDLPSKMIQWKGGDHVVQVGVLTFLFTDIEGSTSLWEESPEAMAETLREHDDLMRDSIEQNGGRIFKTIGDAFCAEFADPASALKSAVMVQSGCSRLTVSNPAGERQLRIRIAVHSGTAERRDGDYFGPTLNRLARILATGHGGQTLVSGATHELVKGRVPEGALLVDLGVHRLKDLGRPEHVYQLCHSGSPAEFPPLRSLGNPQIRHNLPHQVTSFVGRERELADASTLLEQARLLTLTGSGGCGKTRLALQVAADTLDGSGDGVWLIELASLSDPDLVSHSVAAALGVKEQPGSEIADTLVQHLRQKRLLLLIDNCEHVLDSCASLVDTLLRNCPTVKVLATSREALAVAGERTYRVPSLPTPSAESQVSVRSLAEFDSVKLFIERAISHQNDFELTELNARFVAAICTRLDGIPLALELAAARLRSMSVEEVHQRLDQRFRLLTGGSRTALPRQQTLRSLIDWSYDLLTDPEKRFLSRLSVFSGGWSLTSAEEICANKATALHSQDEDEVANLLDSLVAKSLVNYDPEQGRYRLLETVRQYAREKFLDSGEVVALRDAHTAHFVRLCSMAEPELHGSGQRKWLKILGAEHDNLRSALTWASDTEQGEALLRLVACLDLFWVVTSRFAEGNTWVNKALAVASDGMPCLRSRVLEGGVMLAFFQGDLDEAGERAKASLDLAIKAKDQWQTSLAHFMVGIHAVHAGGIDEAEAAGAAGMAIARELDSPFLIGRHLVLQALGAWLREQYSDARDAFRSTVEISRELGDAWHEGISLANFAFVTRLAGDPVEAARVHARGLRLSSDVGDWQAVAWHLVGAAGVRLARNDPRGSAQLLGAAESLMAAIGSRLPVHQQLDRDRTFEAARSAIGRTEFDKAFEDGTGWSATDAISSVISGA